MSNTQRLNNAIDNGTNAHLLLGILAETVTAEELAEAIRLANDQEGL